MMLVVDMNVLFSFFKKGSGTRKLITDTKLDLYSPVYALEELQEYSSLIMSKAGINSAVFDLYKRILFWNVTFVPGFEFKDFKDKAEAISPDSEDVQYFALALKLKCSIWSNDGELKKQNVVKIFSTSELIKAIK